MLTSKEIVRFTYEALEDKKGTEITVLDIAKISVIADYFIIASGNNRNQVQALADSVQESLGKNQVYPKQIEGYQSANWILMDYGDVIIHVFNEEDRLFYDLERIWRDGQKIEITDL